MLESFDTKKLVIFGVIVAVILGVLGFFVFRGLNKPAPEKITLQLWGTYDDASFYSDAIKSFRSLYPNVTVAFRQFPYEEYEQALINGFATNSGPDIFMIHHQWLAKDFKLITPIPAKDPSTDKPLYTFKEFQDSFVDVNIYDLSSDGTIYAMPLYTDTLALYYNKDLFNTAGITTPPATWEDFVDILPRLTKLDERGNVIQSAAAIGTASNVNRSSDILSILMLQSGAQMTDDSNTKATFAEAVNGFPSAEQAVQFYTDFANQAKSDRYTWDNQQEYSIDAFANGRTAMMFNYSHHLTTLHDKSLRLNFGVAPMPQPKDAKIRVDYANYWALTAAKQSTHPVEAWKFILHLTTTDAVIPYINASQRPPARRDMIEKLRSAPEFGVFAPQALTARSWNKVNGPAIDKLFEKIIDDVNFNRATIKEALDSAQNQINVLMRKTP